MKKLKNGDLYRIEFRLGRAGTAWCAIDKKRGTCSYLPAFLHNRSEEELLKIFEKFGAKLIKKST